MSQQGNEEEVQFAQEFMVYARKHLIRELKASGTAPELIRSIVRNDWTMMQFASVSLLRFIACVVNLLWQQRDNNGAVLGGIPPGVRELLARLIPEDIDIGLVPQTTGVAEQVVQLSCRRGAKPSVMGDDAEKLYVSAKEQGMPDVEAWRYVWEHIKLPPEVKRLTRELKKRLRDNVKQRLRRKRKREEELLMLRST